MDLPPQWNYKQNLFFLKKASRLGSSKTIFIDDMIFSIERPKEFTKKTTKLVNEFNEDISLISRYELNIQKLILFLYSSN